MQSMTSFTSVPLFLVRYGIDKSGAPEECSRQAEKAYRELDARFVRMTGRRPYADAACSLLSNAKRKMYEGEPPETVPSDNPP